jgi:ATP-dependent protease ClpP protease subunit
MKKIEIKGQIVSDTVGLLYRWFGISAAYPNQLKQQLADANGEDIILEINSPGGVVVSGYEMYNALKEYKGNIEAHIIYAASAATILSCAADKSMISEAGVFMIHNCSAPSEGDYREHKKTADRLQQINEGIINVYEAKTGKTRDEIQELMDNETFMGPSRAVELKFVDGLIDRESQSAKEGTTDSQVTPEQELVQMAASASSIVVSEEKALEVLTALELAKNAPAHINITSPVDLDLTYTDTDPEIKNEEGGLKMGLKEVLAENPELQTEIDQLTSEAYANGVSAERDRLKELDDISATVPAEMMADAKYGENVMNARDLAYQALLSGQKAASAYMENVIDDSSKSGAANVGAGEVDTGEDTEDKAGDQLAGFVNAKKGAK